MRAIASCLGIVGVVAVTGCGASALPVSQVAPPREDIRAADEIGAENNPQAALHLKYARDEIANADKLLADGDQRAAQLALMRAESDAKLALELTREEKARGEAEEAQRKIAELQQKTQTPPAAMP